MEMVQWGLKFLCHPGISLLSPFCCSIRIRLRNLLTVKWIRAVVTAKDREILRDVSDVALYSRLTHDAIQLPLVWHELSRRLAEKDALWVRRGQSEATLKEAQVRAEVAESKLKEALDSMVAYQAKADAHEGILAERDGKIAELQVELVKTHIDYKALHRRDTESQGAFKNAQPEVASTKSENAALRLENEEYQQVIKEQRAELMRLKNANRSHRHELQKFWRRE